MTTFPQYDVKIFRRDGADADPMLVDGALAQRDAGKMLWSRGEAALIAHQLAATEGADVEFLEKLVDGATKRVKRLLKAELSKFGPQQPVIKSYVTGEPFERVVSEPVRDPQTGKLIGATTLKFKTSVG